MGDVLAFVVVLFPMAGDTIRDDELPVVALELLVVVVTRGQLAVHCIISCAAEASPAGAKLSVTCWIRSRRSLFACLHSDIVRKPLHKSATFIGQDNVSASSFAD